MGPYKYRFRREYKSMLNIIKPFLPRKRFILDAAVSYGKFISLFGDDFYVGVDYDSEKIEFMRSRERPNQKFYALDLTKGDIPLLENQEGFKFGYNLVVTTHTLSHIDATHHNKVIDKLIAATDKDGFMIFHLNTKYVETLRHIKSNSDVIKEVKYRGALSHVMEKKFSREFHKSLIGQIVNNMLSYVDFGSADCILLCKHRSSL